MVAPARCERRERVSNAGVHGSRIEKELSAVALSPREFGAGSPSVPHRQQENLTNNVADRALPFAEVRITFSSSTYETALPEVCARRGSNAQPTASEAVTLSN